MGEYFVVVIHSIVINCIQCFGSWLCLQAQVEGKDSLLCEACYTKLLIITSSSVVSTRSFYPKAKAILDLGHTVYTFIPDNGH